MQHVDSETVCLWLLLKGLIVPIRHCILSLIMFTNLEKRVWGMLSFCLSGWWEEKGRYLPVCVSFLNTVICSIPSGVRVTSTSRKAREPSCSFSLVNLIESRIVFKY